MVVEPILLLAVHKETGKRRACEDDGNSAMPNGNSSNRSYDRRGGPTVVDDPGRTREPCSTEFCGCWAPERRGANCPTSIRRTKPAIAVSSTGETRPGGGFHRCLLHGGKKGGLAVGPTNRGKGTKIIALADAHSLALAVSIESASPHETQLVEGVLGHSFLDTLPARLIGDKAYDSDRLGRDLAERYGIEMIAPH